MTMNQPTHPDRAARRDRVYWSRDRRLSATRGEDCADSRRRDTGEGIGSTLRTSRAGLLVRARSLRGWGITTRRTPQVPLGSAPRKVSTQKHASCNEHEHTARLANDLRRLKCR